MIQNNCQLNKQHRQHCENLGKCIERNDDGTAKYPDGLAVYGAFLELDENIKEEDVNERLRKRF